MALTFASYAVPGQGWTKRLVALAAVAALTAANYRGISRTAALTRLLVAGALLALAVVVAAILTGSHAGADRLGGLSALGAGGPQGILQSAGLLFFAFAGYARIATLGEEVRDPARTIPRAIPLALGIVVCVYVLIGLTALRAAGPHALAGAAAPLATAVDAAGAGWAQPVVRAGAAVSSLGALLALLAGVGRTTLAMARNGDLPRRLDSVHPRYRVPDRAELAIAAVVAILVLTTDLRGAIGFSSFGVLVYYAIANASAYTQSVEHRRWPRPLNVAGFLGCAILAVTLPPASALAGAGVLTIGIVGRELVRSRGMRPATRER
jgi:APA family basic amino acid/polyamine antiporter